jgi:L-rhamnose mutarotase
MSVMSREIVHWILNTICSQHNIRDWSIFISYTFFSKLVRMNDLDESMTIVEQDIVRVTY